MTSKPQKTIICSETLKFNEDVYTVRVDEKQRETCELIRTTTFLFIDDKWSIPTTQSAPDHFVQHAVFALALYKDWVQKQTTQFPIITEERKLARIQEQNRYEEQRRIEKQKIQNTGNYMRTGRPYDPLYD